MKRNTDFVKPNAGLIAGLSAALLLSACATEQGIIPPSLRLPGKEAAPAAVTTAPERLATQVEETPKPPPATRLTTGKAPLPPAQPPAAEEATITLMFDQLPLPTFIQVVYGSILKKNFSLDPQVASRSDLVTLRSGQPQTPTQVAETAKMLLKSYGIAVTEVSPGFYRIVPDTTMQGYAPEIRRGRALPEVPLPLRPIFQLVELQAVRNSDVSGWLKAMFGQKITIQDDPSRNAVLLSGQSDDVTAALEAIHVLDQPLMKGRNSARINPVFWSAEDLAKKLGEVLTAEGYSVGNVAGLAFPVTVLPIQAVNAVIVFAQDPVIIAHVVSWAKELDKPSSTRGAGSSYFTYQARYTDAQQLAKTMQELIAGAAPVATGTTAQQPAATARRPGRVVVNAPTNSLIFQGNTEEYTQLLNLLQELDKPAKAALIEVTVAEVTLTDETKLGVEWAFEVSGARGSTISGGTLGGLGIGTSGLTIKRLNSAGDLRLMLNALAKNSRANILSSPRILARNGETATIQVGDDVPTPTTQQTTAVTGGGVLQSIQYRNTGVVLKVKPIIHAGDRVDLDVAQEVSSMSGTTGALQAPIFSTKKVETKLSLKDGSTVLLGGLMSSERTQGESGVPLLKDIPAVGQIFRVNSDVGNKKELLVLITPYIVADDHDAQAVTEAFRRQLGPWARTRGVQLEQPQPGPGPAQEEKPPAPPIAPAPKANPPQQPQAKTKEAEDDREAAPIQPSR